MPEPPWYDRLLTVLPEAYRGGFFTLSFVVLGIFLYVRLSRGFDWDTALTSYYFGFPCALALVGAGAIFALGRHSLWNMHTLLDVTIIVGGIILGGFALKDFAEYQYQGDYKFSKRVWDPYEAPRTFLEPMQGDTRKYVEQKAYAGQIEIISDRPPGNLRLLISIQDAQTTNGAQACHIIRSRLDFPAAGPLEPTATQRRGSRLEDSGFHEWSLSKLRKGMICVVEVAFGKTANVECSLGLQVREE